MDDIEKSNPAPPLRVCRSFSTSSSQRLWSLPADYATTIARLRHGPCLCKWDENSSTRPRSSPSAHGVDNQARWYHNARRPGGASSADEDPPWRAPPTES